MISKTEILFGFILKKFCEGKKKLPFFGRLDEV